MIDSGQAVWSAMADLVHSDFGPVPSPHWHVVLTGQMAHVLIGVTLALYRFPAVLVRAVFCGWIAKELLGDIPNGDGTLRVIADSLADVFFGALGFIVGKHRCSTAVAAKTLHPPPRSDDR